MTVDRSSRHFGLPTYRIPAPGRTATIEIWQPRLRTIPAPARHVEARQQDRLDLLAYRLTGDPHGAWWLADANAVYDPLDLLEPGRILAVPGRR